MSIKNQITSRLRFIIKALDVARKSQYENRKATLENYILTNNNTEGGGGGYSHNVTKQNLLFL